MTIDQRLEALTHSAELLLHAHESTEEKIRRLAIIAEQNEIRAGQMMEAITRLSRIAETHQDRLDVHERRLDNLGNR